MIFPGFPGVLSFFQVLQVEWEPGLGLPVCTDHAIAPTDKNAFQ